MMKIAVAAVSLLVIATAQNLPVPPLGHAYDAFEPFLDEATMRVHHTGHHAAYTAQLNTALAAMRADPSTKQLAKLGIDELLHHLDEVPDPWVHSIRQAGGEKREPANRVAL